VGVDLEGSYAYSDSTTDIPMLSVVGNPVAVNPDRELRRHAEEHQWQIRDFRRPVRLRSRIASAAPRPSLAVVAGLVAMALVFGWITVRSRMAARDHRG
jgi:hypothetical protein